jgi:hypothetical protein
MSGITSYEPKLTLMSILKVYPCACPPHSHFWHIMSLHFSYLFLTMLICGAMYECSWIVSLYCLSFFFILFILII